MEYKKMIEDFSLALEKSNIFIVASKYEWDGAAHKLFILHLEKENETLMEILETIACSNSSNIIQEKINNNIKKIKELNLLYQ